VNIIHSSSLAYNPVAYTKPQAENTAAQQTMVNSSQTPGSGLAIQASSTNHIQNVLNEAGLSNANQYSQSNNTWTQKAVNAYIQNDKLIAQLKISESISGIDLYA